VNLVGGQDELVFDGNSFVMDARGQVLMPAPPFDEGTYVTEFVRCGRGEVAPAGGGGSARALPTRPASTTRWVLGCVTM